MGTTRKRAGLERRHFGSVQSYMVIGNLSGDVKQVNTLYYSIECRGVVHLIQKIGVISMVFEATQLPGGSTGIADLWTVAP